MTKNRSRLAILAAVGVYTIWGFTFMASKVAQELTTPFVLLAYRFVIAAAILSIPVLMGRRRLNLKGKNIKPLLLLGLMEPCIYFIGEQYGIRYTNSAFSGVMIAVIPIVTLVFAAVFLKDRPTRAQWFFSLLSIGGIILITLSENSGGNISLLGFFCLVIAVLTGSAYSIISRGISDEFSVYERTFVMQLMGTIFYTALALSENANDLGALISPLASTDFILAVLYVSVGASVLGYTLFNYAITNAPIPKVIILCNLTTVISVLAGVVLLGDPFSPTCIIAMVAVLIGIWGVQKFDKENNGDT